MSKIKNEIRDFISENFMLGGRGPELADHESLIASQVVDSTGFLELVTFLEAKYSIVIGDDEMVPANLDCIAAIVVFVERKLAG